MEDTPCHLIIPAAGLGRRMRPVNPDLPKEMLPVGNKPAIQYAVEEGFSAGIREIIIVINRKKEIIRRYFEDKGIRKKLFPDASAELEEITSRCHISFLYQREPLGESDAISLAGDLVDRSPVSIIYPDNIYLPAPGAMKALRKVFEDYRTDVVALMEVTEENASGIGNSGRIEISCLTGEVFRIKKFYPKDKGHFVPRFEGELRACGFMISGSEIFQFIRRAREISTGPEFTDGPVRNLIIRERNLLGVRLPGRVFDTGNPEGYRQCLSYISR
jgi:UTP--glucose-1-phosphate uridylyltransferase